MRSSQDALTSIWVNYYATRAALAQQLGVMELTDDGMWIDQPFTCAERATEADMPLPPAVPEEWLRHLEEVDAPPPKAANVDDNGEELPAPPAPRPAVQAEPMPIRTREGIE